MPKFQEILSRHRRKLIIAGVIISSSIIAVKYTQRKLIKYQEKQAKEFFERSRRMQHYESLEQTCNQVILGMGAELTRVLSVDCSMDELLEKLRQNPNNKVELWEEMKLLSFTKLTTLVYASSMLVVALRIQMNILGGYLYRDIITEENQINDELKQKYLSLIQFFVQKDGLKALMKIIRSKVNEVVGPLPLSKRLTLSEIEQLFWSIQLTLNSDEQNDPNSKMSKYLFSSEILEQVDAGYTFRKMCSETLDLLESEDAMNITTNNISRGFSLATDSIAETLNETMKTTIENEYPVSNPNDVCNSSINVSRNYSYNFNVNSAEIPLAKIIPIISSITSDGFDTNVFPYNLATSLISFYAVAEKSKMLGANIYETFSSSP